MLKPKLVNTLNGTQYAKQGPHCASRIGSTEGSRPQFTKPSFSGHIVQKLGDRQRVVFIVVGVTFFFVLFYGLETRVNKAIKKESGAKVD